MIYQTEDKKWMRQALAEAKLALKKDEVPVGAVVVYEDRIIGRGGVSSSLHGEDCAEGGIKKQTFRLFVIHRKGKENSPPCQWGTEEASCLGQTHAKGCPTSFPSRPISMPAPDLL